MDLSLPGENHPRRLEYRRWFDAHPGASYAELAACGLTAANWPAPWGVGADPELMLIIEQEYARAEIAHPLTFSMVAINQCGQSLLSWGTDGQRAELLPSALDCSARWCMLFSEPAGGSDLASLRTQARRDGDDYVINGHKIWTSSANRSTYGVLLARTDPDVAKHKGISQFIIDLDAPGIRIQPIADMTEETSEYCEVFLENVRVPASRRIGGEGDGWRIAMEQLQTERQSMTKPGAVWGGGPTARELVKGMIATGAIADPAFRDEAAKLYVEGELLRLLSARALSNQLNGRAAGPEGTFGKMIAAPHGQRLSDLAKRTEGPAGMIRGRSTLPLPPRHYGRFDSWDYAYWFAPAATLGAGTQEILKNAVAERVLGLPREQAASAPVPAPATAPRALRAA